MKFSIIKQIAISGILTAVGILLGAFAQFNIGTGRIYLIGLIIFSLPIFLNVKFSILSTLIIVVITDLINGWLAYTWISCIAYGGGIIIILFFKLFKIKFIFIILVNVAALFVVGSYYLLEMSALGSAFAFKDLFSTAIEMAISVGGVLIFYFPMRVIAKTM